MLRMIFMLVVALGMLGCETARPASEVLALAGAASARVQQWDVFELALHGPADDSGNAAIEVTFENGGVAARVSGFYDGDGIYRVRFMPLRLGRWTYKVDGGADVTGSFECVAATGSNHGPVRVHNTFHFAYADGAPYFQIGTTCYNWAHQPVAVEEQTLSALQASPFNKVRMCVLATDYKTSEPALYPFAGTPGHWDFSHFNPAYFQHLDKRVADLRDLSVQADLILFHPYEKEMGFDRMPADTDDRYVRYMVARFGAYRNVWWSLANEFDLVRTKKDADWDRFFHIIEHDDPYGHMRSIHQSQRLYNYTLPWVTHASIQNGSAIADFGRADLYRDIYNKPIVLDEVKYEGNLPQRWGHLTGQEMVAAFWQGTIAGTYVGHSETLNNPAGSWLSNGGTLVGEAPARLAFLKKIVASAPTQEIDPIDKWQDLQTAGKAGEFYLVYFGPQKPTEWTFELPKAGLKAGMAFHVDVLDTWNMTVRPVESEFKIVEDGRYRYHAQGMAKVTLPGTANMALRIVADGTTKNNKNTKDVTKENGALEE